MKNELCAPSLVLSRHHDKFIMIEMSRRSLRFSKSTCPICGAKEVARDDLKGDLICTNCGHIVTRSETRAVGKFQIAQHLSQEGRLDFNKLRDMTGASDDKLYEVLQNMVNMGLITEIGGIYALSKHGRRWYRQRLGQEWGY